MCLSVAGLEALLSWRHPLPRSLTALSTGGLPHDISVRAQDQLYVVLRRLPALAHLSVCISLRHAPDLFAALAVAPRLTYLSMSCSGMAPPELGALPASLEVVRLQMLMYYDLWLTRLAALPCCHSLMLIGYRLTGDAAVRSGMGGSPALRRLWCAVVDMAPLEAARAAAGLPPIEVADVQLGEYLEEADWPLAAAALATPNIRFPPCALLTSPQLDARPSSAPIVTSSTAGGIRISVSKTSSSASRWWR